MNFAGAEACKRCQEPLTEGASSPIIEPAAYEDDRPHYRDGPTGYYAEPYRYSSETNTRLSFRWVVKALLVSIILFFLTVMGVFMWALITTGVTEFSKGWSGDFSPAQWQQIGRRTTYIFWVELIIVWGFFYRRRAD
jgi:hypothetical protein